MSKLEGDTINAAEQAKMMGVSGVEAGSFENDQANKEDPFAVGRARQDAIAASFKATKEKVGGWFTRAGSSIGKFFSKVRRDAIPAVLSLDDLGTKGTDYVMDKADAYDKASEKVAYEAGVGMGKGIAAVGDAMNKGGDALMNWGERTGDKLNKVGDKAVENISNYVLKKGDALVESGSIIGSDWVEGVKDFKEGVINAAKWTDEKMMATADYLTKQQELMADKMIALSEKTGKSIDKFKGGVANQFNNIKNFGENSWMSAKMRIAEIKQNRRDRKNEKLRLAAEAKYNAEIAQLQADLENNKQGEEWAKNQAEAYRKNQEAIQAKLDHMTNVENLFNSQAA